MPNRSQFEPCCKRFDSIQLTASASCSSSSRFKLTVVMSDLISTPSQTQSTVSNDAFEALVDLLTSDGIDENLPGDHTRPQANVSLRDSSGKLDFDKIRLMFTSQHAQKPQREERKRPQSIQTPTLPDDEGDSDDELHSQNSTSTVPSRSHSMSPKLVEHTTAGHRRSSTFGNQPWTPIHGNVTGAKVVSRSCRFWNE